VASIDAQINLILKGVSELKKLSSALDEIENTANSIQDLFGRGVFGRVSDINTYIKALGQIEKTAAATRLQAAAIADVNSETKRALIVESQLRRERSRTARLSRAFEIETKGLDQTKGKLKEIKEQFDEVSVALKSAFKLGDVKIISQLRNELSALVEDQREWNRTLAGTKNTGVNADFLKEQARGYAQQIEQLRKRALALSENEEIIRRLAAAEFNLVKQRDKNTGAFTQFADPRLGRELLSNIKAQITAEEQLARERERFSGQYERQQKEARRQAISTAQTIAAIARKAGGATFDALTFGQGAKVARGARNAAIRGGLGLGALGLGGAYAATQEALGNINLGPIQGPAVEAANAIGGAINNALGGVPAIINDMLSALGNVPGSLGLASVAALAFAPAMKTAADAVFLAGKRFGATKFGEDIKLTLDRQTNLFESVINKASEMNMVLDASRSGLDAVGKKIETFPALPAAGQTAFAGPMRRGRGGAFIGGGARELLSPEFLATATGAMAQRTQEAADTSLLFAEGLGQAATEAKTIAEYLKQANELRAKGESSTQRFIRQTIERGRIVTQGRQSVEIARERSAFLTGSSYSLSQVPARGELFPGGRTETAQSAYRELLNTTARINQLQQDLLEKMSKQQGFSATIGQLERRTINDKGRSLAVQQQENEELQRSVQIIRERNKELRQRPIAAMTPQERVSQGILDPKSLRANRERRIEIGRLDPLERFYAGFQPRRLAARSARATSEGLVGGAFPLLFGQGIGAAALGGLGGAAGGFAGGGLGFGLSLVGTALGTAFDTLNQAAQDTGKALRYPIEGFEQLKEAGLLASRQQEYYISKLIEAGRLTEAAGEIQAEIIRKIGVQGVEDLQRLGDSSSRLSKAWAEFNLQLQAALAGPMADLLNWVGGIVGEINTANRQAAELRDFMQSLTPQQQKEYLRRSVELRNQNNGVVDPVAIQRLRREFLPNGAQQPQAVFTQEQLDAQKQAQAVTQELQAQVALQAKQLSLTGLTLERDGARYINAARAVALQEYENKLLEIKNGLIGKIFNAEQNLAQIRGANLELAARLRQVNEEIAQRQEQLYQNSLQAEIALYQEAQKRNDLIVRFAAFNEGEEAGLKRRLSLMENMRQQRLAEFYTEAELAMIQARKNGTAEQTAALYASRLITLQSELDLEEGITKQQLAQLQLSKFIAAEESKRQAADPFVQFRETQELDAQYAKTYYRLLKEGVIPAEAERIASFERLVSERLKAIDSEIAFNQVLLNQARESGVAADEINRLITSIENLNKARGAVTEQAALGPGPAVEEIPGAKIQEFISTAQEGLNDLESYAIRVSQGIGDAVGNSLSNGVAGLIEGTATAKEVFAGFLKDVGQILASEGAKMIATYIAIGIARIFAGLKASTTSATGPNPGGIPSTGNVTAPSVNGFDTGSIANIAANGAYFDGGMAYFANGGIVSSPTLFQFADGGVPRNGLMGEAGPEAIMPLERGPDGKLGVSAKLSGAMSRYSRSPGAAGGPEGGSGDPASTGEGSVATGSIDVRYTVERINNVDYVTADQFQQGMARAAQEGAQRGQQLTLRRLQQSPATRRKLGVA